MRKETLRNCSLLIKICFICVIKLMTSLKLKLSLKRSSCLILDCSRDGKPSEVTAGLCMATSLNLENPCFLATLTWLRVFSQLGIQQEFLGTRQHLKILIRVQNKSNIELLLPARALLECRYFLIFEHPFLQEV
jgi:hypothetical protein